MTEKSEDQVVWACIDCKIVYDNPDLKYDPHSFKCAFGSNPKPFVPYSKYLALKADLDLAVETLEIIRQRSHSIQIDDITSQVFSINNIAEEALGKIKEKHETIPER